MSKDEITLSSNSRIQIRKDLERSEQRHQGASVLVVKDPVTRRYFRFTEAQAAIIALMEEPTDAESLAAAATERLGRTISPETIAAFFNSLEQKLLVETPKVRETIETMSGQRRKDRNLLYWKLASIDPERAFAWLLPRTRWAFKPAFHVLGIFAILCGFGTLFANWDELMESVSGLFSGYGLVLVIPVIFLVITIHEFSHGLTCCHFGGKVHEIGFMLIYFQPAFYCDVSDSWLFPSRRDRMWVTFAGGYAQFIFWGLCAIVWRVADTDTLINQAALVVLLYSGVQSLINFNPLIKLDGYYLLSDYLEIPNLRAKASKTVWNWVAGGSATARENRRELRAQLIYGVAAILFSTGLLLYVYSRLYTLATARYEFAGLIGFVMFSTYTLRKTASESMSGVRAFAARASIKRWRNLGIAATLALITIFGQWELKIPVKFHVYAPNEQPVVAETDGIVFEIRVQEGGEVRKGDVIARMRDVDKQRRIFDIEGLIAERQSHLALLLAGSRKEEIEAKQQEIDTKKVELGNASRNRGERGKNEQILVRLNGDLQAAEVRLKRDRQLSSEGIISRKDFEGAEDEVRRIKAQIAETKEELRSIQEKEEAETALKQQEVKELQSQLILVKAGNRPEEIQRQRNEIARLEKQRSLLKEELDKTDILAPIDGVVSTPYIEKKVNQRFLAGQEFCRIVDIRRVRAEMRVPEKELADVQMGNPVWMKLKGFPNEDIEGRVDFIASVASVAQPTENQQMFVVRSDLANDNKRLAPEMTGVAKIYCGKRRIIELMTRSLEMWIRTEFLPRLP